jgi:hypothetical protein
MHRMGEGPFKSEVAQPELSFDRINSRHPVWIGELILD